MGIKSVFLNTVTLGGHGRVQDAIKIYEVTYSHYEQTYAKAKAHDGEINKSTEMLGKETIAAFNTLRKAHKILLISYEVEKNKQIHSPAYTRLGSTRAQKALTDYSASLELATGAGVSAAAAVGSWSLVTLLGSASTGTAIASLSGAAATNATLAWFGGGALAAGGGGMAAGMMTLGGIVAVPLLVFTAWSTHSKANEIVDKTTQLESILANLKNKVSEMTEILTTLNTQINSLKNAHSNLADVYILTRNQLFPYQMISRFWRLLRVYFGYAYYKDEEIKTLEALDQAVGVFSEKFVSDKIGASAQKKLTKLP
jgi:hypothetical protein